MNIVLLIFLSGLSASCAFKESQSTRQESSNASQQAASSDKETVVGEASLTFPGSGRAIERKRPLVSDRAGFKNQNPFVSPVALSDDAQLHLNLKLGEAYKQASTAEVTVTLEPPSDQAAKIIVHNLKFERGDDDIAIEFDLEGVSRVLATDGVRRAVIKLNLSAGEKSLSHGEIVLLSPPGKIETTEIADDQAIQEYSELGEIIRTLRGDGVSVGNTKFALLRLLKIKNANASQIRLNTPSRLTAHVSQQIDSFTPRAEGCRWHQEELRSVEMLSQDIRVVPIADSLGEGLANRRGFEFGIQPGASRLVGVFASGPKVLDRLRSRATQVPVSTCYSRCLRGFKLPSWLPNDACQRCANGDWRPCEECKRMSDEHPEWGICAEWGFSYASTVLRGGVQTETSVVVDPSSLTGGVRYELDLEDAPELQQVPIFKTHYLID